MVEATQTRVTTVQVDGHSMRRTVEDEWIEVSEGDGVQG